MTDQDSSMVADASAVIDREKLCPFLLKMYYHPGHYHRVDAFSPTSTPPQSSELRLYTWKNATLGEISSLVKQAIPDLLSQAGSGAHLGFRHVYLDQSKGLFVGKDVGSVHLDSPLLNSTLVILESPSDIAKTTTESRSYETTLRDFNFVIGDYLDIAITSNAPGFTQVTGVKRDQQLFTPTGRGASSSGGPHRNRGGKTGRSNQGGGRRFGEDSGAERTNPLGDRFAGRLGGAFSSLGSGGRNGHGQSFGRRRGGLDVQNEPSWKDRGRGR